MKAFIYSHMHNEYSTPFYFEACALRSIVQLRIRTPILQ